MRLFSYIFIAAVTLSACQSKKETADNHAHHPAPATPEADTLKKSLPKETHAMIGDAHITIKYTAPVTKGRVIWGGLVPYNEVWVTGAHRATSFEIDKDFAIGKQTLPAGKYAIFTIPGEETWTFILNKNWDQHLTDDYNAAEDILHVDVKPEYLEAVQERLTYTISEVSENNFQLSITWEKIRLTIPVSIQ